MSLSPFPHVRQEMRAQKQQEKYVYNVIERGGKLKKPGILGTRLLQF